MPTRLLYEKVCTSATLAALSAEEERFFYRLLVQCDDFGRFHADPVILRNRCFQRMEDIRSADVRAWRDRLEQVGLIRIYSVGGEEYLAYVTWPGYQRQRASQPRYPGPDSDGGESPQPAAGGGELPLAHAAAAPAEVAGSRRPEAEGRRPEADIREPEAGAPPKPSPPSGEGSGAPSRAAPDRETTRGPSVDGSERPPPGVAHGPPRGRRNGTTRREGPVLNGRNGYSGCPAGCPTNHGGPSAARHLGQDWLAVPPDDRPPWGEFLAQHGRPDLADLPAPSAPAMQES